MSSIIRQIMFNIVVIFILIFLFKITKIYSQKIFLIDLDYLHSTTTKNCLTDYWPFIKITFKQLRRKKDKRAQHFCKCYCTISVMGDERCHINLFNDYTASIYVNGKCKHKHIRSFLHV